MSKMRRLKFTPDTFFGEGIASAVLHSISTRATQRQPDTDTFCIFNYDPHGHAGLPVFLHED